MSIELKLSRSSRVYRPTETISGQILTTFPNPISFSKITITVTGTVNLQVQGGVTGVINALYSVVKPIQFLKKNIEIVSSSGKLGQGKTETPFSFILRSQNNKTDETFYETYHGGNISIQYLITAHISRGYLHKPLSCTLEFIVEIDRGNFVPGLAQPGFVNFYITQDNQKHELLPELVKGGFQIVGRMTTQCSLKDPIVGELTVEESVVPIQSIDVQLLRIESINSGERVISDISTIQTTQIADGDICKSLALPIYIILPRLLVCPTLLAGAFSIEFQVSIIIKFESELSKQHRKYDVKAPKPWLALVTLPLELFRT